MEETMKDLIFDIFNALAETAMEKNHDIELRYENSHHEGKTIISSSNSDTDALTMSIQPIRPADTDEESDEEEDEEED